jgi:hypothetical protein
MVVQGEQGPLQRPATDAAAPKEATEEFEQRLELLGSILEAVDLRSKAVTQKAVAAQHDASDQSKRQGARGAASRSHATNGALQQRPPAAPRRGSGCGRCRDAGCSGRTRSGSGPGSERRSWRRR